MRGFILTKGVPFDVSLMASSIVAATGSVGLFGLNNSLIRIVNPPPSAIFDILETRRISLQEEFCKAEPMFSKQSHVLKLNSCF